MVTAPTLRSRLLTGLRRDWHNFRALFADLPRPTPGLHTFRIPLDGGQKRIHLRIEKDGSGVLFVDVTDAIHLNGTAVEMTYLALCDFPQEQVQAKLHRRVQRNDWPQLDRELHQIYEMVLRFQQPETGCPTCAVEDLQRTALFSHRADAPYKADLAITYGCNNGCNHCYNEPERFDMPSLPRGDWFRIINKLHEIGIPHLIITGGEATLHPDLPEIIRYADNLGHVVGMNTNGRRLAHQPYLQTLEEAGLNHVQITLGSNRPDVHDAVMNAKSFHQTVRGIQNGVNSTVHTITNTTLMRRNMDHVEEIIDFLHDLGIRTFAMNGMIYSGGGFADPNAISEAEMPALLIRVRDHAQEKGMRFLWYTPTEYCRMSPVELEIGAKRCNAGEYSICIEPNGDVLPCQSYYAAAGNILRDPWEQVWRSDLFRSFRDREANPVWAGLPEKCHECPDLPLCGGGCRIEREARGGNRIAETEGGVALGGGLGNGRAGSDQRLTGYIPLNNIT
ncbi:MAG: radical SAM protein [Chloroflexi bacterium]|nr:radical SAM protein [Chloroflexota bacterium]